MEQPWPPPGPWSLPRAEGEAEEESDLDLSPGSPRCPQLPGGGTQVRREPVFCGVGGGGNGRCRHQAPRDLCLCDPVLSPHLPLLPTPDPGRRGPHVIPSLCNIYWALRRGAGHIFPTSTSTHTFFTLANFSPLKKFLSPTPLLMAPSCRTPQSIMLTLCPLVPALIRALYSREGSTVCAQLMGTVNGCVSIILWAPD